MKIRLIIIMLLVFSSNLLTAQDYSSVKSTETIMEGNQVLYIHIVEKGNTLYNISKTYGVPPNIILDLNPALNEGLDLGMRLKIPILEEQKEEKFIYHIVKKKETLYQISKIYNVKVEDIERMNKISAGEISPGQYLKIPSLYMNAGEDMVASQAVKDEVEQKVDKEKYVIYQVQPKETMFSISKRYGLSTNAIMYLNDLSSSDLSVGQKLILPKKLTQKQKPGTYDVEKYTSHKVKPKETLYGIAKTFAVSIAAIKSANNLGDKEIQIGQTLLIPRELNRTGYIQHKVVERKEKLTEIASKYDLSVRDLKKANPDLNRDRAKRGQNVRIPLGYIETEFDDGVIYEEKDKVEEIVKVEEDESGCSEFHSQTKTYQIALMLPLYLNEVDTLLVMNDDELLNNSKSKPFRFIEFYEGFMLAAQEIYDEGFEFNIHVYDIQRDVDSTAKVLLDPNLKNMDLIITLSFSDSFKLISDFSKTYNIPVVNALSKRREIIYNNPNVFKIEPQEEALYEKATDFILREYADHNIIIVKNNPYQLAKEYSRMKENIQLGIPLNVKISHDNILYKVSSYELKYTEDDVLPKDFAYKTTESLKELNPAFDYDLIQAFPEDSLLIDNSLNTVIYSIDSLQGIIDASSLFRDNLVVALGQNEVFAIELFTQMNFVRDSFNYEVIGLPYWSNYTNIDVAYTQPMKLKVVDEIYIDYSKPEVKSFVLNFRSEYGIEPEEQKHAFLGYDLAKYFMTALKNYGTDFGDCLHELEVELLQSNLKFEHLPELGYENINWNILKQESYQYHKID